MQNEEQNNNQTGFTLLDKAKQILLKLEEVDYWCLAFDDQIIITEVKDPVLIKFDQQSTHILPCKNREEEVHLISFDSNFKFSTQALVCANKNGKHFSQCIYGKYLVILPMSNSVIGQADHLELN